MKYEIEKKSKYNLIAIYKLDDDNHKKVKVLGENFIKKIKVIVK